MNLKTLNIVLFSVMILLFIVIFFQFSFSGAFTGSIISDYLSEGYIQTNPWVVETDLHLISGCDSLSMSISGEQALSINLALSDVSIPRPLTHDLVTDFTDHYDIEIVMVTIERMEDDTYFAYIFMRRGNSILKLDSRPSDAVAIALRQNIPIFVRNDLMLSHGHKIC